MSKAVKMKVGKVTVFVETDESVEVPADVKSASTKPREGVPEGFEGVVSIAEIKREFSEVQDMIIACCEGLYDAVSKIPKPEKFAVEFGVKLAGEGGLPMLTKVSGEANFKVSIEWKKE